MLQRFRLRCEVRNYNRLSATEAPFLLGRCLEILGGAKRDRTADLLHAMQALSQLSYSPVVLPVLHNRVSAKPRLYYDFLSKRNCHVAFAIGKNREVIIR